MGNVEADGRGTSGLVNQAAPCPRAHTASDAVARQCGLAQASRPRHCQWSRLRRRLIKSPRPITHLNVKWLPAKLAITRLNSSYVCSVSTPAGGERRGGGTEGHREAAHSVVRLQEKRLGSSLCSGPVFGRMYAVQHSGWEWVAMQGASRQAACWCIAHGSGQ